MAKTAKYPRTLYKSPGTQVLVSSGVKHTYDSVTVNNVKEQDAAEEMGYIDSFHDAIFHAPKTVRPEPKKEETGGLQDDF